MVIQDPLLAVELLRQARRLRTQLFVFDRIARKLHSLLSPEVPSEDVEVLSTPASNLVATLESLFAGQLEPVRKDLAELDALLEAEVLLTPEMAAGVTSEPGPALAVLRVACGLRKKDLAEAAGLSPDKLSKFERSQTHLAITAMMRLVEATSLPFGCLNEAHAFLAKTARLRSAVSRAAPVAPSKEHSE